LAHPVESVSDDVVTAVKQVCL